jgi:hypothetical protein
VAGAAQRRAHDHQLRPCPVLLGEEVHQV